MIIKVEITSTHPFVTLTTAMKELQAQAITIHHRVDRDELDVCYPLKIKLRGSHKNSTGYERFIVVNEKYENFRKIVEFNKKVKELSAKTEAELSQSLATPLPLPETQE